MSKEIIKIKLHGEGIAIRKIAIPPNVLQSLCSNLCDGHNPALLDPFFYHTMNSKLYRSVHDVSVPILEGLIINNKSKIEIWTKGKRVRNFTAAELLFSIELFPTFILEQRETEILEDEYYYIERSIGPLCIYSFKLQTKPLEVINFLKTDIFGSKVIFNIAIPNLKDTIKRQKSLITNQNIQKYIMLKNPVI